MSFTLNHVVPWGRSLAEYTQMFALTDADLHARIVDCGSGPASFNAEMTSQGYAIVSCDPIYQFSATQIAQRIAETHPVIVQGVAANLESYLWQDIKTPEQLGEVRLAAMNQFLTDFEAGKLAGRYIEASLPTLPFSHQQFDLALCSHFLFSYSTQLGWEFHQAAIAELCRVAREVRIFPLLTISGEPSPFVEPIQAALVQQGYHVQRRSVPYEFQRGGNQLLSLTSAPTL